MNHRQVELVLDAQALLGEGPSWHAASGLLYWVDIEGRAVHLYDREQGTDRQIAVGEMVGCVVPRAAGGAIVTLESGFYGLDLTTGQLEPILDPEPGLSENRFNDGKCDPAGRLWAGTTRIAHDRPEGTLYCLDTAKVCHRRRDQVLISNGLAWSLDQRKMYFIDSPTQQVVSFPFDLETGTLGDPRTIIEVPSTLGGPDGMTIDEEGMLWIALWDGWRVTRWDPTTGRLLAEIPMPVARPTSCVFGGPNLDELYITTARTRLSEVELAKQPTAGGLFRCRPGVRGTPTVAYAG
jgi:sugar lactone lactonase YvrE